MTDPRQNELRRLWDGPGPDERAEAWQITEFRVFCPGNAKGVLDRCREVLDVVLREAPERWPTDEEWRSKLPGWFVSASAEEISQAEADRRLKLPMKERLRYAEQWSVGAFVYWFLPGERMWYWWNATVRNADRLTVQVWTSDVPVTGSLRWLLTAAGATSVHTW